ARVLARIHSPHVIRVVDLVETPDGRPCIITERLYGESLEAHLGRVREMSIPFVVRLVRQVAAALTAAHAAGVIHRDLKPANVFLESEPDGTYRAKLLDFGIARTDGDGASTRKSRIAGTPAYMAPEQAVGHSEIDTRADVYAAGALLDRLLSVRAPFAGADALTVLH
ncbi:MAG: serine/threonine protein kinase, partial [Myxococcales bacterium]|nr:serine/threonine protein kinase [Myxococcales bacterium]